MLSAAGGDFTIEDTATNDFDDLFRADNNSFDDLWTDPESKYI
jgi:hypothetical protein